MDRRKYKPFRLQVLPEQVAQMAIIIHYQQPQTRFRGLFIYGRHLF